jgi:hypothetical protein
MNEERDIEISNWVDVKSASESYSSDFDLELYCEDLGKLRSDAWAVI